MNQTVHSRIEDDDRIGQNVPCTRGCGGGGGGGGKQSSHINEYILKGSTQKWRLPIRYTSHYFLFYDADDHDHDHDEASKQACNNKKQETNKKERVKDACG